MPLFKEKRSLKNYFKRYAARRRNRIIRRSLTDKRARTQVVKALRKKINSSHSKKLNISRAESLRLKAVAAASGSTTKRMAGQEFLHRAAYLPDPVATTKKILVKAHARKGNKNIVQQYYKTIIGTPVKTISSNDLSRFKSLGTNPIESANTTFIVNNGSKKYVYKESPFNYKEDLLKNVLGFKYSRKVGHQVSEAFYSDLASRAGVKSQKTILVPAGTPRPFGDVNEPATLHEFVPGIEALEAKKRGYFKQSVGFALKPTIDRRTELPHNWSRKMTGAFSHKDTSKLLALDIFTSNMDRHPNNYFFNKSTNSFTGIDHGESLAVRPDFIGIRSGIVSSYDKLDNNQRKNLKLFKNTLKTVVRQNPPSSSKARLDSYYKKTAPTLSKQDRYFASLSMERKKEIVDKNYQDTIDLIDWMEKVGI